MNLPHSEIRDYLRSRPADSQETDAEAGAKFGVSRQRIHQLRKALNIERRPLIDDIIRVCPKCGVRRPQAWARRNVRDHPDLTPGQEISVMCPACRPLALALLCDWCGQAYTLTGQRATIYRSNHVYAPVATRSQCPDCRTHRKGLARYPEKQEVEA